MATYYNSILSSIIGNHHHHHAECLRRKVTDNTLINIWRKADPQARGVGRPHSLTIRRILTQRPSIVDRLAARSVTGQSLDIRVHQHIGYRVHFEWKSGNGNKDNFRAMERRFFMYSDAKTFCIELYKFELEGLCSCMYDAYHSYIPVKAPYCRLGPFYPIKNIVNSPNGG
jgi:hypothetical protein